MKEFPTAVLADDEPLLRHHLNKMLAEVWPQLGIVSSSQDGLTALSDIEKYSPDIVFLDIRMPGLDGMALAEKLNRLSRPPKIVFITAYDEYAIRAFDQNAVDYLLKPIDEERLEKACHRLKERLRDQQQDNSDLAGLLTQLAQNQQAQNAQYLTWIKASRGEDIHLIATEDVLYFRAGDKYVSVYRKTPESKEEFIIRTSLKELLQKLDPGQFWQIHRSTVVNVSAVEKVKKGLNGQMSVLICGEKLPVSRSAQGLFKSL